MKFTLGVIFNRKTKQSISPGHISLWLHKFLAMLISVFAITYIIGDFMGSQATLEMIYDEVKKLNERLRFIEDVIEEVLIRGLPEVELDEKQVREIRRSIEEMRKGDFVAIEELESA